MDPNMSFLRRALPLLLCIIVAVSLAVACPAQVDELAPYPTTPVPAVIDLPTNVVTELGTLCSDLDQFGLRARHCVVFESEVITLSDTIYEASPIDDLCHVRRTCPGYFIEGYFRAEDFRLFTIGTGQLSSAWTDFNSSTDSFTKEAIEDLADVERRIVYVDTALRCCGQYWLSDTVASKFGTYYRVELEDTDELLQVTYPSQVVSVYADIFVPNDDNDTMSYKVRYTYTFEENDQQLLQEYYEFDVMLNVFYDLQVPTNCVTDKPDVFEYLYKYVMR